jgi:hypothetical protein
MHFAQREPKEAKCPGRFVPNPDETCAIEALKFVYKPDGGWGFGAHRFVTVLVTSGKWLVV